MEGGFSLLLLALDSGSCSEGSGWGCFARLAGTCILSCRSKWIQVTGGPNCRNCSSSEASKQPYLS